MCLGVELLKNRGYDSAGLVLFSKDDDKTNHTMIKKA